MGCTINELMTDDLITMAPNDNMTKAKDIFESHAIHHIPVVSADGHLEGIISKSDFYKILHGFTLFKVKRSDEYNQSILNSLLAKEVMTERPISIPLNVDVMVAVEIFKENLIHALPIIDQQKLVGIITPYDIMVHAFSGAETKKCCGGCKKTDHT